MLKKVLTPDDCAKCRNCCVFYEKSRWETPVVSEEKAEKIKQYLNKDDCVVSYNNSYSLASIKRTHLPFEGAEEYRCVALDEDSGCTLGPDEKPFDCSLWPVRIMKKDDKILIMLAKGCHTVNDTFIEKINKILQEGLKEQIISEVKKNPDIIKPYCNDYIELCDITKKLL